MSTLTDKELSLTLEVEQTRLSLFKATARAAKAEYDLMHAAQAETFAKIRELMLEQEARAKAKAQAVTEAPKVETGGVDPLPPHAASLPA